jgi:hypothetical protein
MLAITLRHGHSKQWPWHPERKRAEKTRRKLRRVLETCTLDLSKTYALLASIACCNRDLGCTPTNLSTTSPFLKIMSVGMLLTP